MRKHLELFRKDRDGKFRLILVESRIHRLARYYKVPCCLAWPLCTQPGRMQGVLRRPAGCCAGGTGCASLQCMHASAQGILTWCMHASCEGMRSWSFGIVPAET